MQAGVSLLAGHKPRAGRHKERLQRSEGREGGGGGGGALLRGGRPLTDGRLPAREDGLRRGRRQERVDGGGVAGLAGKEGGTRASVGRGR